MKRVTLVNRVVYIETANINIWISSSSPLTAIPEGKDKNPLSPPSHVHVHNMEKAKYPKLSIHLLPQDIKPFLGITAIEARQHWHLALSSIAREILP